MVATPYCAHMYMSRFITNRMNQMVEVYQSRSAVYINPPHYFTRESKFVKVKGV